MFRNAALFRLPESEKLQQLFSISAKHDFVLLSGKSRAGRCYHSRLTPPEFGNSNQQPAMLVCGKPFLTPSFHAHSIIGFSSRLV